MLQSSKAAKSVIIMIIFGIGGKLLGFIREVLIAAKFGSGAETDTFFIALTATGLFTMLLTQSLNNTVIPILHEIETKEGKDRKQYHLNNLLNIVILVSLLLLALGWILAPVITKLLAQGFEGEQLLLTIKMMRMGMPVIIFAGVLGVFRGHLQSELMFIESSVTQFPLNLTYIFFLLFLSSFFGIEGLIITSVFAVVSQLLIQVPGIKKSGYGYKFVISFRDPYLKKVLYLILPVLISVSVNDLNKIVNRSLASTLVAGSISALNYSGKLNSLVLLVYVAAISTVLFPMLSKEAANENHDNMKKLIRNGVNVILIITIPATVGMMLLSKPIVKLAFERGAFDAADTQMAAVALFFYSLGLVGMALRVFIERVYFSLQDTRTPMLNGFIAVGLNIMLSLILIGPMALGGLALANSIASTITSLSLFYGLRRKIGNLGGSKLIKCGMKSLIASLIMGALIYFIYYSLESRITGDLFESILLLGSILFGGTIYFIILYLFKINEINWFIAQFNKRLKRRF